MCSIVSNEELEITKHAEKSFFKFINRIEKVLESIYVFIWPFLQLLIFK